MEITSLPLRPAAGISHFKKSFITAIFLPVLMTLSSEIHAQEDCFECHGDTEFTVVDDNGVERSLFVDSETLANSVHAGFDCIMCHVDAEEIPHAEQLEPAACGTCHEEALAEMAEGVHSAGKIQDAPSCGDCHGSHDIRTVTDSLSRMYPKNQPKTCGHCHADPELVKKYHIPIKDPLAAYSRSIHGRLLLAPSLYPDLRQKMSEAQLEHVATCSSCHGVHKILPLSDSASPIYYENIPHTCGQCHQAIAKEFAESVHGLAVKQGLRDAPVCTDCHGEHAIESPAVATAPTAPRNVAVETCGRCHASTRIVERYGLRKERLSTFQNSYHGLALRSGRLNVANCASCHGVHDILPSSDPRSMIYPANLVSTCGTCHGNVNESFARGPIHVTEAVEGGRIVAIVRTIYILLIVVTISGMLIHNAFDFYRKGKLVLRHR